MRKIHAENAQEEKQAAAKEVSGYLGALRASIPHFGVKNDPVRMDYSIKAMGNDGRMSIVLDLTYIASGHNDALGSYTIDILRAGGGIVVQDRISFYKGKVGEGVKFLASADIADPGSIASDARNPGKLIGMCAVELLVGMAEDLDEERSLEGHAEAAKTMQALAAIRQAAVDSQGASGAWGKRGNTTGIQKRGNEA
jgi:hypothetical protein